MDVGEYVDCGINALLLHTFPSSHFNRSNSPERRVVTLVIPTLIPRDPNNTNYLNLLTITAMISKTNTVMIAIVISRFVAILHTQKLACQSQNTETQGASNYLRAIPLNVLILRSVYPSLSNKVSLVCPIVSLCRPKSARVLRPTSSVSNAIL